MAIHLQWAHTNCGMHDKTSINRNVYDSKCPMVGTMCGHPAVSRYAHSMVMVNIARISCLYMKPDSDIDRSLVTARVVTKHYETQPLSYKKLSSGRETARCFVSLNI